MAQVRVSEDGREKSDDFMNLVKKMQVRINPPIIGPQAPPVDYNDLHSRTQVRFALPGPPVIGPQAPKSNFNDIIRRTQMIPQQARSGSPSWLDQSIYSADPDRPTQYYSGGHGLEAIFRQLGNLGIDIARGGLNNSSWLADFLFSRPPSRIGDHAFGVNAPSRGSAAGGGIGARFGARDFSSSTEEPVVEEDPWLRYMRMAEQYMPGGRDWDAIEAALRANHANSDAQIQAMYRALQGEIAESGERIGGYYDTAQERTNQVADETAGRMGAVRDMNRQQAGDMLSALGIEDSAAVNAAERAYDLPNAVGGVEARRQSALDSLIGNQAAGQRMTERIGQGAGFGEASRRSDLLQYLTRMLGDLEFGKSEEQAARQQALVNMAMGLREAEASGTVDQWERDMALAKFNLELQKFENDSAYNNQRENRISFLELLKLYGNDTEGAQQALEIMRNLG